MTGPNRWSDRNRPGDGGRVLDAPAGRPFQPTQGHAPPGEAWRRPAGVHRSVYVTAARWRGINSNKQFTDFVDINEFGIRGELDVFESAPRGSVGDALAPVDAKSRKDGRHGVFGVNGALTVPAGSGDRRPFLVGGPNYSASPRHR